jgi:hypothetical protein
MRVTKAGREEAREHGVPLKLGQKLANDHTKKFGKDFYPALERFERNFLARKNRKRKRN